MSKNSKFTQAAKLPDGFETVSDRTITAEEILAVRREPVTVESITTWEKCLEQSLYVVGVREVVSGSLVGIGFVTGNQRHVQLVDGTVHPDFRELGIGRFLLTDRIAFARAEKIRYIGLTHDENSPWLKAYYERYGFKSIGFAMWLSDSLEPK